MLGQWTSRQASPLGVVYAYSTNVTRCELERESERASEREREREFMRKQLVGHRSGPCLCTQLAQRL